ncbi:MAG TPA: CsbD family protein [Blastocatellia bacterium]|nr:CsbD family protein [Blastocatellia bacterium]
MNWDQVAGNWKQAKGKVREKWGKLTDDDLGVIAGKRDQLVGRIQERYGIAKEEAERQADAFVQSMNEQDYAAEREVPRHKTARP